MFFQTQIKYADKGRIVDVQGRNLRTIGNFPCHAGDTVWTDGKVIFGHIFENAPSTPIVLKGIPILGDELRGYVKKSGNYKEYNIAQDDWIVNDSRTFLHGEKNIDGQKVIEADIIQNEQERNLYVVTDGFFRKNQCVKYNHHLFWRQHSTLATDVDSTKAYSVLFRLHPLVGEELTLGVESDDINQSIKIFKDDNLIQEISLKPYADFITEKCWTSEPKIMAKSQNNGVNYYQQPVPPSDSFIASTYARPISFRINQNGDWDAIIFASSYGFCFPYALINGSVLEATFNSTVGASTSFSNDLIDCVTAIDSSVFGGDNFPFLEIEKYPSFTGDVFIDDTDEYTDAYKQYIEDKIAYYIPRVRFQFSVWYPVVFGASCLLKIHNGEMSIMKLRNWGGNKIYIHEDWNEQQKNWYALNSNFVIPSETVANDWVFPLDEDFYCKGYGDEIQSICNSDNTVIANLTDIGMNIGRYFEIESTRYYYDGRADNTAATHASALNNDVSHIWLTQVYSFAYTVNMSSGFLGTFTTNNYENWFNIIFPNLRNNIDYFLLGGFFDEESEDGFFRFNPCIAQLPNGNYLLGVHDGEVFLRQNNVCTKIDEGLKNFRLRELKNIAKAKK